jgi:phasin
MIKPTNPFQVPEDVRSMIEQGVSQAREGFGKVLGAASEATATLETKSDAAAAQAAEMRRKGLAMTETTVNAAFDFAQKMVTAKSLEDVFKLQTEFMTTQFQTFQAQMREAGEDMQKKGQAMASEIMGEAAKVQARAKTAVEEGVEAVRKASKPKKG